MEELKFAQKIFRMFQAFLLKYFELHCCLTTFKVRRLFCLKRQNIFSSHIRKVNLSNITSFWETTTFSSTGYLSHVQHNKICYIYKPRLVFHSFLATKTCKQKGFTFYVKNVLSASGWIRITRDSHLSSLSRQDGKKLWTERYEKWLMNIYSSKNKQKLSVSFFFFFFQDFCAQRGRKSWKISSSNKLIKYWFSYETSWAINQKQIIIDINTSRKNNWACLIMNS